MIAKLSVMTVEWLLRAGAISENDRELYEYAAYSFLFSLLPLILVMLLGAVSGMLLEGVLMIVPFMLIRKFSGGFHLQSSGVCFVSSTLLLSAFLFLIRLVTVKQSFLLLSCFVAAAAIQLFLCSPIDNEARKLSAKERAVFKKVARIMSALLLAVYIVLGSLGLSRVSVPVGAGIILTALLQIPCFFVGKHPSA